MPKVPPRNGENRSRECRGAPAPPRPLLPGAAPTHPEKAALSPGEPPTCSVAFQDATELPQEFLKLRVIWPQVLAALDGREEGSTQQRVGHQGAEEAEAREQLLQGLLKAPPGLGWPGSLHPPRSARPEQELLMDGGRSGAPAGGGRRGGGGGTGVPREWPGSSAKWMVRALPPRTEKQPVLITFSYLDGAPRPQCPKLLLIRQPGNGPVAALGRRWGGCSVLWPFPSGSCDF